MSYEEAEDSGRRLLAEHHVAPTDPGKFPHQNLLMSRSVAAFGLVLVAGLTAACSSINDDAPAIRDVTVLYTNDEHGWMEGMAEGQGAASLYALWQSREGYTEDGPFLILSGGDNWTGPAVSTLSQGESMVEVMNAMGYDASALGNHEFDFGLEVLKQRTEQADYPYLSANTRWQSNGEMATELGILPYTLTTVNDVRFGIVGLTTRDTSLSANPVHVGELRFIDYERALRETLPAVAAHEPDLLLVISHVCVRELEPLIRSTQDLDIAMVGAGHCNELVARRIGDTVLLGGGFHFSSYAVARFRFNVESGELLDTRFSAHDYRHDGSDETVASLVSRWSRQVGLASTEDLAYLAEGIPLHSEKLGQLVVNAWLEADPQADVALTNAGGLRTGLPAGGVNAGTLVALMPFNNTIVAATVSGAALERVIAEGRRPIVGGLRRQDGGWIVERTGEPLHLDRDYRVLLNSFIYAGGDNYGAIASADPDAFDTGIHYRQPLQEWLQQQASSPTNPLRLE